MQVVVVASVTVTLTVPTTVAAACVRVLDGACAGTSADTAATAGCAPCACPVVDLE